MEFSCKEIIAEIQNLEDIIRKAVQKSQEYNTEGKMIRTRLQRRDSKRTDTQCRMLYGWMMSLFKKCQNSLRVAEEVDRKLIKLKQFLAEQ